MKRFRKVVERQATRTRQRRDKRLNRVALRMLDAWALSGERAHASGVYVNPSSPLTIEMLDAIFPA